jgi:hypothetical protein
MNQSTVARPTRRLVLCLPFCALALGMLAESAHAATFTTFDPPGSVGAVPQSINTAGAITGSYYDGSKYHGFVSVECQPPAITALTASPSVLWAPNHKMVPATVSVSASGGCGSVSCQIISVSSNEPIDAGGEWNITGPLTLQLTATRLGLGTGRVYIITLQCMDAAGNVTTQTVTVTVPHAVTNNMAIVPTTTLSKPQSVDASQRQLYVCHKVESDDGWRRWFFRTRCGSEVAARSDRSSALL